MKCDVCGTETSTNHGGWNAVLCAKCVNEKALDSQKDVKSESRVEELDKIDDEPSEKKPNLDSESDFFKVASELLPEENLSP